MGMESTWGVDSVLRPRAVQQTETPDDSSTKDGSRQPQDAEKFHHGERRRRASTETGWAQSQSGAADNEVEEHDTTSIAANAPSRILTNAMTRRLPPVRSLLRYRTGCTVPTKVPERYL